MFTISRQSDSHFKHEPGLKREFFDQGLGNKKIINSWTKVIGGEAQAGVILFTLEQSGCRD